MTTELSVLAWSCLLAFVHIFATAQFRTRQYGAKWNLGPRDEPVPPPEPIVGRLTRAQANFFETFPIVIAAILGITIAGRTSQWTEIGAILWLVARIVYLPLYGLGIPLVRSLAFTVSMAGIVMLLWPLLFG